MEGHQAVLALLTAGRRHVRQVWVCQADDFQAADETGILAQILARAQDRGAVVRRVSRETLSSRAGTTVPQGVLAWADPLPEADADELIASGGAGGEVPFLLAVDGVTDPRNLGALLRSAEAAGVTGVLIGRHRSASLGPAAVKAAAGAIESLEIAFVGGIPAVLARASRAGLWVVGLDGSGSDLLFDLSLADQPIVIVVGAEGEGLSRLTQQRCQSVVKIPMAGAVSSLNVATAGALALFEVRRRRGSASGAIPLDGSPRGGTC